MAGDISQDLKTGYLIGATPARQQTAELFGAIINAGVIAFVVLAIGTAEGFGTGEFPAPQATLMKTVIDGVLSANLPWGLVLTGGAIAVTAELLGVPSLAFAVGMYLPLSAMSPVFVGGCLRALVEKTSARRGDSESTLRARVEQGVLFASGLIAGEGVMGIGRVIYASITGSKPEGFGFGLTGTTGSLVSLAAFALLGWMLVASTRRRNVDNG
jgi:putative OPT family oligopeptide transporter